MPGETPDWGAWNAQATIFPVDDLGELAARLGSPITFDRRGDVAWWDDFECSLNKWVAILGGAGASVQHSSDRARNGRYSVLLIGGSDNTQLALIVHGHPFPVLSRFGFEVSFNLVSPILDIRFSQEVYDGTNIRRYQVRWRDAENDLQFLNSGGTFTTFRTGVDLSRENILFHTAKLVVDSATGRYHRFLLDATEDDLSANAGLSFAAADSPRMDVVVQNTSRTGQNDSAYVDDAIITQNEPL